MRNRQLLAITVALLPACVSASFHATTTAQPAIADRALPVAGGDAAAVSAIGIRVGTIETSGQGGVGGDALDDRAEVLAATRGGTHVREIGAGATTTTTETPATTTHSCTPDGNGGETCTDTYVPASTTTTVIPYAIYDVLRVEPARWSELPSGLQPLPYDPSHHAPTSTDGFGLAFGMFSRAYPGPSSGTSGDVFPTRYAATTPSLVGGWMGAQIDRGSNAFGWDLGFGGSSFTGTAMNTQMGTAAVDYTGTYFGATSAIRFGKRIAWNNVALAAGVGLGGALWMATTHIDPNAPISANFVQPNSALVADWYAPLWSAVTLKASCDWGLEALAEYDVRPDAMSSSSPSLALGAIWQPATACQ